jgi:hypothetical protein
MMTFIKKRNGDHGSAPLVAVLIFVVATSLVLGSFLMLSNSALQKNESTRSDDFSAQLESSLETALSQTLASYVSATPGPEPLPGTAILETSVKPVSDTAKVSAVEGSNPWVVTIDGIENKDVVVAGSTLIANAGTGSLGGASGCVVIEIQQGKSVVCSTSGTQPSTGTVSNLRMKDYVDCAPDPLSESTSSGQISIVCTPFDGSGNGTFYPEDAVVLTGKVPSGAGIQDASVGKDYGFKVSGTKFVNVYNSVRNYSDAWSGNLRVNGEVFVPETSGRTSNSATYLANARSLSNGSPKIVTLTLSGSHGFKSGEVIRVTGQSTTNASSLCNLVTRTTGVGTNTVSYQLGTCDRTPALHKFQ